MVWVIKKHDWERPGRSGTTVHTSPHTHSQRRAAGWFSVSIEVERVCLVAQALDRSRAGTPGRHRVREGALGLPWARSRRWGRHFDHVRSEVTRAHIDDKPLDINAAYARFVRLAHMRLQAYGYKWYRWYSRQQFRAFPKVVPLKHRQKKLIESGPDAEYLINPTLSAEFRRTPDKERN